MTKRPIPGEFELIARFFAPLARDLPGAFGLADDGAVLDLPPGRRLVATTDALAAGVHFLPDDPPDLIARKLLRVNLSDLAAMGATPLAYLLTLALSGKEDYAWLEAFSAGLAADQAEFGIVLAGGDTIRFDGALVMTLTALGTVEAGRQVGRAGARPGDLVYLSGTVGDGALGLAGLRGQLPQLSEPARAWLAERYRLPRPRLALGARLAGLATAALDVSDGVAGDLAHICEASGVGAEIEAARLPLSEPAKAALASAPDLIAVVVGGGDDYELLFTTPPARAGEVAALARSLDLPITPVGRITRGGAAEGPVRVLDVDGRDLRLARPGFVHF